MTALHAPEKPRFSLKRDDALFGIVARRGERASVDALSATMISLRDGSGGAGVQAGGQVLRAIPVGSTRPLAGWLFGNMPRSIGGALGVRKAATASCQGEHNAQTARRRVLESGVFRRARGARIFGQAIRLEGHSA